MSRSRLSSIGRILGLAGVAILALPVLYVLGTYALLLGAYALVGAFGLVAGLLEGLRSPGDLGAFAELGFWISLVLLLSAGTLYGIWIAVRSFLAMAFPRRAGPEGWRSNPSVAINGNWTFLLLPLILPLIFGMAWLVLPESRDDRPKTHVTIYLAPAIVKSGGILQVAGIPMPDDAWRAIPPGDNPAMLDPANPKAAEVGPLDRHFGAQVYTPAAVVELRYPEGGTYTFNIRPAPKTDRAVGEALTTEQVSIGSSSMMIGPETGGELDWPSVSTIAILGPGRDAGWARTADHVLTRAFEEGVAIRHTEGVRTLSLSEEQVQRLVGPLLR